MRAKPLVSTCQRIISEDMNTRRVSVKIVPHLLTIRSSGNFWLLKTWPWSLTPLARPVWPPVTAARFREWNRSYKGVASTTSLKFSKNRVLFFIQAIPLSQLQRCFQQWQKHWTHFAQNRKGITMTSNEGNRIVRYRLRPETFGYA